MKMQLHTILLSILYFILGINLSYSQSVPIQLFIKNSNTQQPLAYATVYSVRLQTGVYSTEDGLVEWTLNNSDTIIVSFLSYESQKIAVKSLTNTHQIFLKEAINQLNTIEVRLSKKRRKIYRIGFYDNHTEFDGWGINIGSIAVNRIHNNTQLVGHLKTLHIDLGKAKNQPHRSIARLRVYEIDSLKKEPGRDVLTENIVFSIPKFSRKLTIDLSRNNITFPLKGLFIGVEFLGFETKDGLKTSWKLQSGANITSTKRDDYRSVGTSWMFPDSNGKPRWEAITDGSKHKAWEKHLFKIGADVESVD